MQRNSPEGRMAHEELQNRKEEGIDKLAAGYFAQAEAILSSKNSSVVYEELSRFCDKILIAREGVEQDDAVKQFENALRLRKNNAFENIPDDEQERSAFAIALCRAYKQMRQ